MCWAATAYGRRPRCTVVIIIITITTIIIVYVINITSIITITCFFGRPLLAPVDRDVLRPAHLVYI